MTEEYLRRTPSSRQLHARAREALPGGVSGNLRYYDPYPTYFARGEGSRVFDVDGNKYVDCFLGNGPLLLGHRHPDLLREMAEQTQRGLLLWNPDLMIDCAETLKELAPCADKVRFLNTGTEATLTAVRVARAFTGKNKIVKFYGHYHGQDDQFLVGQGPSSQPLSPGIPSDSYRSTVCVPCHDIGAVKRVLDEDEDVAAVIIDADMNGGGIWPVAPDYLAALRELTAQRRVVLILDEVITGFRLALGGAQQYYGVNPDMATYAKALSAGERVAAVAGREEIMCRLTPESADLSARGTTVFQSGTVNDATMGLAATLAALRVYKTLDTEGAYGRLQRLTDSLADSLVNCFKTRDIPCRVNKSVGTLHVIVGAHPTDFAEASKLDITANALVFLGLLNRGVLTSPPKAKIYLSHVHTEADASAIVEAFDSVLAESDFSSLVN